MSLWPSQGTLFVAGLLCAATACAQDVSRPSALKITRLPVSENMEHWSPAQSLQYETAPTIATNRHWWYEDYPRSREIFPELRFLHAIAPPAEEDFSPVVMKWSLSGRYPILPTVEIAGMDTWSPGTWHVPDPSQQYGHFQSYGTRTVLGAKLKHLILEQLKY